MMGLHAMTMHVYELDSRITYAKDNVFYYVKYFSWIDYKITNPTELVSQFLELWTDRYDSQSLNLNLNRKEMEKEISIPFRPTGRIHTRGGTCADTLGLLWPSHATEPARHEAWPSAA
jgi:hypothetical protein